MKDLNTLRPYHIRLTADGEVLDGDYLFGAVCNSTSIGGLMKLDPERVVLDDGRFELLLIRCPKTPARAAEPGPGHAGAALRPGRRDFPPCPVLASGNRGRSSLVPGWRVCPQYAFRRHYQLPTALTMLL